MGAAATRPWTDAMLMIDPPDSCTIIWRAAAAASTKQAFMLISTTRRNSAGSWCSAGVTASVVPALLTTMSIRPNSATARSTRPGDLGVVGHVARGGVDRVVGRGEFLEPVDAAGGRQDDGPVRGEDLAESVPDAAGGAGDDGDAAVEAEVGRVEFHGGRFYRRAACAYGRHRSGRIASAPEGTTATPWEHHRNPRSCSTSA